MDKLFRIGEFCFRVIPELPYAAPDHFQQVFYLVVHGTAPFHTRGSKIQISYILHQSTRDCNKKGAKGAVCPGLPLFFSPQPESCGKIGRPQPELRVK